jgi:hypothetical protein
MNSRQPNILLIMVDNQPAMRRYYAQVSMVDDGIGQVLAKLKEKGALERSLGRRLGTRLLTTLFGFV